MSTVRARRSQGGQMLIPAVAAGALLLAAVSAMAVVGSGYVTAVRAQRVADLVAVSAVRARVVLPAAEQGTSARVRAAVAARVAPVLAADGARIDALTFPHAGQGAVGTTVEVRVSLPGPLGTRAVATARAGLDVQSVADGPTTRASGGGYAGSLVHRDGKPTCPSVAAAFDLMDAAARSHGIDVRVNSAFRSDAEQAVLFARHPDPKWVAPPGRSRHREATELDLGPPAAYGWLAANASRFGFVQRYSWEPWHYGYVPGCGAPTPAVTAPEAAGIGPAAVPTLWGDTGVAPAGAAPVRATGPLPEWVPRQYRDAVVAGARAGGVPPALLAALLRAESGFDPRAISRAGALGIAQFMPATAAGVGLRDPFDAAAAIPAAGRLLGSHLRRFGTVPLALAAYNAGPGAVERYRGIPPYPETRAYVTRILTLVAGGAGTPASGAWSMRVILMPDGAT